MKKCVPFLLACLLCLMSLLPAWASEEPNALPYEEIADQLRGLGIQIPDEILAQTIAGEREFQEIKKYMGRLIPDLSAEGFAQLLTRAVGKGVYDYEQFSWQTTSADVYVFDMEVFDAENMYRLFLQGVAAIVPGFSYTDAQETLKEGWSIKNLLIGGGLRAEGVKTVSFILNGRRYQKDLNYYHDWFDLNAVRWINDVLAQEGFPGQLHMWNTLDDSQEIILIYGDQQRAEALAELLGDYAAW